MRVLCASLMLLAVACTNEAAIPAFVAIDYQVRCLGACNESVDDPGHRVSNIDGEEDLQITCETSEVGGKPTLTFKVECPGGKNSQCSDTAYSLRIEQLSLGDGGKVTDPGDGCAVTVREGKNTYRGACTGGDPDPEGERPCSVSLERDGSFLNGSLMCHDLPNELTKASTRYVVGPGSTKAVTFKLEGCTDL